MAEEGLDTKCLNALGDGAEMIGLCAAAILLAELLEQLDFGATELYRDCLERLGGITQQSAKSSLKLGDRIEIHTAPGFFDLAATTRNSRCAANVLATSAA
jgi:hypothetical protein